MSTPARLEDLAPAPVLHLDSYRARGRDGRDLAAAAFDEAATLSEAGAVVRHLKDAVRARPDGPRSERRAAAHERLELLFDDGELVEIGGLRRHRATGFGLDARRPYSDGVVTAWGLVHGRKVFAYSQDSRVFGGSLGEAHAHKIERLLQLAGAVGAPVVGFSDGGGARIQEGITSLAGYGGIFRETVALSGVVPQISVVMGPSAGGAAYTPALTDFVFMVRGQSQMYVTGPDVIATVTGEDVTAEELGGARVHATTSGVAAFTAEDEESCIDDVRYLLSLLPSSNAEPAPWYEPGDSPRRRTERLLTTVPANPRQAYDVRDVLREIADDGEILEVHEHWSGNVVCALTRLDGHVVGLVANQPAVLAGALDSDASAKVARFVQFCDAFGIPLVTLVDVPGFLPGVDQEHGGIIRHGAKVLFAYCDATVPRVQLILRKAYGGAYIAMDSRMIGADVSLAWPCNEVAVMGPEAAVRIIHRREIDAADDGEAVVRLRAEEMRRETMHPLCGVERGFIDDVIDPAETRIRIIDALETLRSKRAVRPDRRHGNQPV